MQKSWNALENKQGAESPFDPKQEMSYNNTNDVIRIDRKSIKPTHDPKCEHVYKLAPDDADSAMFDVYKCTMPGCPMGVLVDKS